MDELNYPDPGFPSGAAQSSALRPAEIDGNGHDSLGKVVAAGLAGRCVSFQVAQDLGDDIGGIKCLPLDMQLTVAAERHFRRSDESLGNCSLHSVEMLASLPSHDHICSAIPDNRRMRSVILFINE
jgi:hypothetical protein